MTKYWKYTVFIMTFFDAWYPLLTLLDLMLSPTVSQQKGIIKLKKKNSASKPKEAYVSPREEFKMASANVPPAPALSQSLTPAFILHYAM